MSYHDSTGKPITVGDRVKWRGKIYTIKNFGHLVRDGVSAIYFEEESHRPGELADETQVDLAPLPSAAPPEPEEKPVENVNLADAATHMRLLMSIVTNAMNDMHRALDYVNSQMKRYEKALAATDQGDAAP